MTNEVLQKIASDEQNISSSNGLEPFPKLRFKDKNGNDYLEWKTITIKDALKYEQPQRYIVKIEDYNNSYPIPVLTANKAFILGYTKETEGIYNKGDTIIYDDFTMDLKFVKFNFKVKSSAIKILTSKNGFNLFFIFCLLTSLNLKPQGHQRSYISILEPMKVWCPTFEEQQKIADFLSLVDQRIEKQRQLVESLKKYKRGALSRIFNDIEDWEKSEAKDIATIETGCSNTQDNNPNGLYPFYIRSANIARSDKYIFDGEAVLTIGDGQIGKVYHYINGKFDCHQRVYMITKFKKISGRYFYHFFSTFFYNRAIKMSAKNTVDSVRMDMIAQMPIYFPDKEKQEQIVSTLDTIDRFINKQTELLEQMTSLKKGFLQQMFI